MKFLVVGLGSMGKRRVRNLLALEHKDIIGCDFRADRREEASQKYGIKTFDCVEAAFVESLPDAVVISLPPDRHLEYVKKAVDRGIACFIEASVTDADGLLALAKTISANGGPVVAPSCTMRYFPAPIKTAEIVKSGKLGKIYSINYHVGQYLPDWHPWENINEFYVSKRQTGGCREIVPFELTWLNQLFGQPSPISCFKSKLSNLDADIDDVYHSMMRYPTGAVLNLTIDVLSRPKATRKMQIIGSEGLLTYDGDTNSLKWCNVTCPDWQEVNLVSGTVEKNYIYPEEPYILEMADFIKAVEMRDASLFPNSLEEDVRVLRVLYELEELSGGCK